MLFDEDQRRARGPAGAVPRALETRNQRRLAFDAVVVRAVHTQLDGTRFAADPARLQVLQSLHQLLLELLLAADVLARLVELGREERAQLRHGFRPTVGLPPALERLARLLERDAEPVKSARLVELGREE